MDNMFDAEFTEQLKQDYQSSALDGFNFSVENFGIDTLVNSVPKKVLLKNRYFGNEKEISAKIDEIHIGDIVEFKSQKWLIIDLPVENEIYSKATIRRCNTTFPIKRNKTKILSGRDNDGRPIYSETFDLLDEPCIVSTYYQTGSENQQLPLPQGTIDIIMNYMTGDNIAINKNFKMYGQNYVILEIDYTKVLNGKGIVTIRGGREVGS